MSTLISGSLAYDLIMDYSAAFRDQWIDNDNARLNLVFHVPTLRREFGGCAGNIAYTLKGMGGNPFVLAAVGHDFAPYLAHWQHLGINAQGLYHASEYFTAQAFIITDANDNQITAFHPGAMDWAHKAIVPETINPRYGIVSPNGKVAMQEHIRAWRAQNRQVIFDPGQALPLFSGEELRALLPLSHALMVNEYEAQLMQERTGLSVLSLAQCVNDGAGIMVVTLGEEGVLMIEKGRETRIKALVPEKIADPTGCGDALRGALLYGLENHYSWHQALQLGCVVAGIKINYHGPQKHPLDWPQIKALYQKTYQQECPQG